MAVRFIQNGVVSQISFEDPLPGNWKNIFVDKSKFTPEELEAWEKEKDRRIEHAKTLT